MAGIIFIFSVVIVVVAVCCGFAIGRSLGYDAGYSDRMTEEVRRAYRYR